MLSSTLRSSKLFRSDSASSVNTIMPAETNGGGGNGAPRASLLCRPNSHPFQVKWSLVSNGSWRGNQRDRTKKHQILLILMLVVNLGKAFTKGWAVYLLWRTFTGSNALPGQSSEGWEKRGKGTSHPNKCHIWLQGKNPKRLGKLSSVEVSLNCCSFSCVKVLSRNHALLWYENGKFYLQVCRFALCTFFL